MRRFFIQCCCTFVVASVLVPAGLPAQTAVPANAPYKDTSLPVEKRVADLLGRMTLE